MVKETICFLRSCQRLFPELEREAIIRILNKVKTATAPNIHLREVRIEN